eukprot:gnl/TRDRNA2_/TRDRNA2_56876_c0_seq1.p1 gnl/TRDRNA2_/TRDRNA2_56876_c0~~gnl/TRDRNA2_/TRDRNA2_56876_c0_seq1.p1  ORF type:complete len:189 (+),score=36.39 gnl/TRDRNA2_/TRDRNA2_56876_c0_seq1:65-631(+)
MPTLSGVNNENEEPGNAIIATPKAPKIMAGRSGRTLETQVVNGHVFSFLPSLEGKWSGETKDLNGKIGSSSLKISFKGEEAKWEIRTTSADPTGVADVHTVQLDPFAHGQCIMNRGTDSELTYTEQCGDLFATITQRNVLTGSIEKLEIWALQTSTDVGTEQRLTRTTTTYNSGSLVNVIVAQERKVE